MKIKKEKVFNSNYNLYLGTLSNASKKAKFAGYKFFLFNGCVYLLDLEGKPWDVGITENDLI